MKKAKNNPINIALSGAAGRMGRYISKLARDYEINITYATYNSNNPVDIPQLDLSKRAIDCDLILDFSTPLHSLELLEYAAQYGIPFISGVTGFSDSQISAMKKAAQKIPVFYAANMSFSFNAFMKEAEALAKRLGAEYDIEILDTHHKYKKDAPSGATYMLLQALQSARNTATPLMSERFSNSESKLEGQIGIASLRSGSDMVGEHRVIFASDSDRVEIMHRSANQTPYAAGALKAAKWLLRQKAGFYGMEDLL